MEPNNEHYFYEIQQIQSKIDNLKIEILQLEKKIKCKHEFVLEFPSGPRDNGEFYYVCRFCQFQK